jgi:hypothetical protein
MSSAVAMNRRISRDTNASSSSNMMNNQFEAPLGQNEGPRLLRGNAMQKHYQILNFHETRLNQVFDQVHVLTSKLEKLEPETNLRLQRLEQENAALRRFIVSIQKEQGTTNNTVTLDVTEN